MDKPQRLARRQEEDRDGSYGGHRVPASGSGAIKGDRRTETEYIEFKHTERLSYPLKVAELLTVARHAITAGLRMVLEVEFTNPRGLHPVRFVVLNKDEYIAMRDELADLRAALAELKTP